MRTRPRAIALISGSMALAIGLLGLPQAAHAAPAAGTFALTGMVKFLGEGGATSGTFPCKMPTAGHQACVANFTSGAIGSVLSGESAEGVPFSLLLTTPVDSTTADGTPQSAFTYIDDLGGATPECTQSFGAGTIYFDTGGRLNEASGLYHNATNPSLITGAKGSVTFSWRSVGTAMAFTVTAETIDVNVFGYGWRRVMGAPLTTAGGNGAGAFALTSSSPNPVIACATNSQGTSNGTDNVTATVGWDFALNAGQ
jgi:hypothetical protein